MTLAEQCEKLIEMMVKAGRIEAGKPEIQAADDMAQCNAVMSAALASISAAGFSIVPPAVTEDRKPE